LIIIISCYYFLDWTADYGRQQLNDNNQGYFGIYERAAWSREDKTGVKWMERVGKMESKLVGCVFVKDESWPIMRIV
jgi:hypothetical protein